MPAVAFESAPAAGDKVTPGAAMASVSVPVVWVKPVGSELSVMFAVKVKEPLALGVPVIVQFVLSCVPLGSAPEARVVAQLYGVEPPLGTIWTPLRAVPRVPLPVRLAESVGLLTGTVTVAGEEVPPPLVAVKVKLSLPRKWAGAV